MAYYQYLVLSLVLSLCAFTDGTVNITSQESKIIKDHPNRYIVSGHNASWSEELKTDLLKNYDRYLRPDEAVGVTTVKLGMVLKNVDLDYVTSKLSINSWISMKWKDPALKWNPKDYGDVKHVYLAPQEVWQPDLSTFNSAGGNDISPFGDSISYHIVYPDGTVSWVPPCKFTVYCDLDLTYWPFDIQTCDLILGSWVYDGNSIDFNFEENHEVEISQDNSLWEVTKVTQKKDVEYFTCCPEPYVILTYTVSFRLRSPAYGSLIFVPTFVILILTAASFYLPPRSSEKFLLCGTNIIMTSALLIFFSHKLPLMVSTTPVIVMFYTNTLCLLSISMIFSIIVHSVTQRSADLPKIFKYLMKLKFMKFYFETEIGHSKSVFGEHNSPQEYGSDMYEFRKSQDDKIKEWKLFATVVDRTLFYIYVAVLVILIFKFVI